MKTRRLIGICLLSVLMSLIIASEGMAQAFVSDTFALGDGRVGGEYLSGQSPEKGPGLWKGRAVFLPQGGVTMPPSVPGVCGMIAIPADAREIVVQSDVTVVNSEWVAVALVKSDVVQNIFAPKESLLFAALRPTGEWALHGAGGKETYAKGKINGFDPANAYTLALRVTLTSATTGKAVVLINADQQGEEVAVNLPATVGAAGFAFLAPAGGVKEAGNTPSLKNFEVQLSQGKK